MRRRAPAWTKRLGISIREPTVPSRQSVRSSPMKLLAGGLSHETNTFSSKTTTVADFFLPGCWSEGEALYEMRGTNTELGGFIEESEARGIDLVMTVGTHAAPMGRVEDEMVDIFLNKLFAGLEANPDIDGGARSGRRRILVLLPRHRSRLAFQECSSLQAHVRAAALQMHGCMQCCWRYMGQWSQRVTMTPRAWCCSAFVTGWGRIFRWW